MADSRIYIHSVPQLANLIDQGWTIRGIKDEMEMTRIPGVTTHLAAMDEKITWWWIGVCNPSSSTIDNIRVKQVGDEDDIIRLIPHHRSIFRYFSRSNELSDKARQVHNACWNL